MNPKTPTLILGLVICIAILIAARLLLERDEGQRSWEIFTEMQYSHAHEPQSPGLLFAGASKQALPAGVAVRDAVTRNDMAPERLFGIYCAVCHGPSGKEPGPVARRGMVPPPSLHAANAKQLSDAELFEIISKGRGNMAGYEAQLGEADRRKLVSFVRKLQGAGQ